MENTKLSGTEIGVILESLKYSKIKIEEYQGHPSYELKQKKIEEINNTIAKVKLLKKESK